MFQSLSISKSLSLTQRFLNQLAAGTLTSPPQLLTTLPQSMVFFNNGQILSFPTGTASHLAKSQLSQSSITGVLTAMCPPAQSGLLSTCLVPLLLKHTLLKNFTDISQRNVLRHHGRLPQLPYADLSNQACRKLHLL